MPDSLKILLAQCNPVVGDLQGNLVRAREARARATNADIIVFPELFITGYPPEDLVLKPFFNEKAREIAEEFARETADGGPAVIIGAPWVEDGLVYNATLVMDEGRIIAACLKHDLPNYGVFDEKRVFAAGPLPGPVNIRGVRMGVMTCEDMWSADVAECLEESGAEILVVPNGSPFEFRKGDERMQHAVSRVTETGLPVIYLNQIAGQDELVFDGGSFVLNADRSLPVQMPSFTQAHCVTLWTRSDDDVWVCAEGQQTAPLPELEQIYQALVLGLRDYVTKNGFPGVLLGLSGGVDSAISAAVAVDALGADKVHCVMMPYRYTSQESLEDAAECATLLGVPYDTIAIEPAVTAFQDMLAPQFEGHKADVTEENIQSRSRGLTLMALSNKLGHMVLSTGNKSEMSVGYATLYGDMCGGYNVLKDVYKTTVFALCHFRNQQRPANCLGAEGRVIPERIITKPPSAELREDQKDEDSLPPYDQLDDILTCLIEEDLGIDAIIARGHSPETVQRIWRLLDIAEYKRRQACPGVKISRRSFGRDRRYPITNSFRSVIKTG